MSHRVLLFDLDGTLIDSLADLTDSVNHVLSRFCFEQKSREQIASYLGDGLYALFGRALPSDCPAQTRDLAYPVFVEHYSQNMNNKTLPFEGVVPLLTQLKEEGYKIGVVSNKDHEAVQSLCLEFFPEVFAGEGIKAVLGTRGAATRKPNSYLPNKAMEILGGNPKETVLIGDSEVDIKTAQNAGIDIICVGWGYRTPQYLREKGAKTIVDNPKQLGILLTKGRLLL